MADQLWQDSDVYKRLAGKFDIARGDGTKGTMYEHEQQEQDDLDAEADPEPQIVRDIRAAIEMIKNLPPRSPVYSKREREILEIAAAVNRLDGRAVVTCGTPAQAVDIRECLKILGAAEAEVRHSRFQDPRTVLVFPRPELLMSGLVYEPFPAPRLEITDDPFNPIRLIRSITT